MKQSLQKYTSNSYTLRQNGIKAAVKEVITMDGKTFMDMIRDHVEARMCQATYQDAVAAVWGAEWELSTWWPDESKEKVQIYKIHWIENSPANKIKIRHNFNAKLPSDIYAICVCCGRPLSGGQVANHVATEYGMIGPECKKTLAAITFC